MKKIEDYKKAASRVLAALENSNVPISWHEIYRPQLEHVIAIELSRLDKEKEAGYENASE